MNERSIFMESLDKDTPAQRSAYLDRACAGDAALRQRVEALLRSHEGAGSFLGKPAPQFLAEKIANPDAPGETQGEAPASDSDREAIDFLTPSEKPGSLGRLGHYEVLETIGRGGMGVVLKAFDEQLHRVVAIKVMAPQLATNATARKRFVREAQAAAAIRNEHVIDIHAVVQANELPYLVMEYVAGISLQERLDRGGPLGLKEILRIGLQTACGLAAAHAQGLIHRDVKPSNILLENGVERVRISDFGLARAVDDASLTQSGVIAGTPQYMAPEQARGEAMDHRGDLFSLGSVLYALCTGRAPFRASGTMAVLKRVSEDMPRPIPQINPDTPDWLAAIIAKLHAKNPADRFQSASDVAELLNQHLAQLQQPALVPMPAAPSLSPLGSAIRDERRPRGRRRRVVAAALLLLVIGGIGMTEATGVTNLRATVIRIFTPDGTLVVEVDDPGVKVTIEGDGGIVITGAGPQEVRLRPGSYKVRATKDGNPVREEELVTITRGEKQVVTVRLDGRGRPLAPGEIRRFEGHTHPVNNVAFSSDGRHVVTASGNPAHIQPDPPGKRDDTVRLWDVKTGKELRRFVGHGREVVGVAISRDGQRILSGAYDNTVRLWDAQTGQELRQFTGHTAGVHTVAFSPDVRYAASAGGDNHVDCDVHLWELESGKELRRFKGHTHLIANLAFSPDGRHLLTGSLDFSMRLWNVESGKEVRRFDGHTHWVTGVAVSRDGRHAVSGSFDATARVWEVESGKELKCFAVPQRVVSVAFSPDGRRVLAGTMEGVMYLWDLQTGKELQRYEGRHVAISPDGRQALSGSVDGTVRLWELPESVVETQPFAVLGGKGVEVRKCDTLAEAVQGASDGDTIEVRGNGPFVTEPVNIGDRALVIRAGAGFRPVIELSPAGLKARAPLLASDGRLVLEGLELRRMAPAPPKEGDREAVLYAQKAPLHVANCRLLTRHNRVYDCSNPSVCSFLNCELLVTVPNDLGVSMDHQPGSRLTIENCVQSCYTGVIPRKEPASIRLTHNTSMGGFCLWLFFEEVPTLPLAGRRAKPLRVEATGNIFHARRLMGLCQMQPSKIIPPRDVENFVKQDLDWSGRQNLYMLSSDFLVEGSSHEARETILIPATKGLAGWKQFWNSAEADSLEGLVRYQGGDVLTKLRVAPQTVTPDDFRLRPDSPGYRAGKDGKDLGADVELVGPGPAYERWKKTPAYPQWLKETKQVTKAEAAKAESNAFVVLRDKGIQVRKFDNLAEAVQGASDGDTIEVRGNGPFVCGPVVIKGRALTIRAALGFRPVCQLSSNITTNSPLVLEGLELQRLGETTSAGYDKALVYSGGASSLHIANCRFRNQLGLPCVATNAPSCLVRNCEFLSPIFFGLFWSCGKLCEVDNCLLAGVRNLEFENCDGGQDHDISVRLTRSTFLCADRGTVGTHLPPTLWTANEILKPIRVDASANIFDTRSVYVMNGLSFPPADKKPLPPEDIAARLRRVLTWRDQSNLYALEGSSVTTYTPVAVVVGPKSLADWKRFWGPPEGDAIEGRIRYQGGDLLTKLRATPEKITPDDFRLRPDSPGYRAGKDGKDPGADVDLVGPGPAYERWKKTPDYQKWLKETKQFKKAEAPTAEPKAFVVLTGKGIEVRKFATLAEAVQGASNRDTIEIRGNGPFVTDRVSLGDVALTIRAADGFRPVLKLTAEAVEKCLPILETSAPLVLEGLELQQVSQTNRAGGLHHMLISHEAPLRLANCRLFMKDQQQICVSARYCPTVELHNCEFFTNGQGLLLLVDKSSKCLVSNCVQAGGNMLGATSYRPGAREALVRLERNTLATSTWLVHLSVGGGISPKHWGLSPEHKLVRIKAADNILDANSALTFAQWPETPSQGQWSGIKGQEAESAFRTMIQWDDGRNVFATGASSISWLISGGFDLPHGPKSLSSWNRFWGNLNAEALEGQLRYQGGNLAGLLASGPDKLTAEHFRLRPDSAGYRAGKDDKDLGADIDLVGTGKAYQRWKKTPEYKQWLKDTGQGKN